LLPVSEAGSSVSLVSVTSSRPSDSEGTLSLLASAARNQTYQMIKKHVWFVENKSYISHQKGYFPQQDYWLPQENCQVNVSSFQQ
jgi:hypothetical protein